MLQVIVDDEVLLGLPRGELPERFSVACPSTSQNHIHQCSATKLVIVTFPRVFRDERPGL